MISPRPQYQTELLNMSRPTLIRCLLLTALYALSSAQLQAASDVAAPAPTVKVVHAQRGTVMRYVRLPAQVHPLQQATLYAKVAGYLKSISVDKGDTVKQGALIAEIEAPELIADVARYQAELDVAKAEYDRTSDAVKKAPDLIMPIEADRAKGRWQIAKANLERIQTLLAFARISAPFAGTITKRYVDLGAFIPAATSGGNAQTAAIVTLMNFSTVRVQVAVPESEASLVAKGQPVHVSVEGLPGRNFDGQLTRFSYALDENSKTMLAEIELANPSMELRPGMYASVQLGIERHNDVLMVPSAALLMEKTNAFVFTADQGKAHKVPIKMGFNDGTQVEVVDGVTPSESIILLTKSALSDGQVVQVLEGQ